MSILFVIISGIIVIIVMIIAKANTTTTVPAVAIFIAVFVSFVVVIVMIMISIITIVIMIQLFIIHCYYRWTSVDDVIKPQYKDAFPAFGMSNGFLIWQISGGFSR